MYQYRIVKEREGKKRKGKKNRRKQMRSTVLAETKKYSQWLSLQNKVHSTDLDQKTKLDSKTRHRFKNILYNVLLKYWRCDMLLADQSDCFWVLSVTYWSVLQKVIKDSVRSLTRSVCPKLCLIQTLGSNEEYKLQKKKKRKAWAFITYRTAL